MQPTIPASATRGCVLVLVQASRSMNQGAAGALGVPAAHATARLAEAFLAVHRPSSAEEAEWGRRRLAFDELLDLQLMLIRARAVATRQRGGVAFKVRRDLTTR